MTPEELKRQFDPNSPYYGDYGQGDIEGEVAELLGQANLDRIKSLMGVPNSERTPDDRAFMRQAVAKIGGPDSKHAKHLVSLYSTIGGPVSPNAEALNAASNAGVLGRVQSAVLNSPTAEGESPGQRQSRIVDWKKEALATLRASYAGNWDTLISAAEGGKVPSRGAPDEAKYLFSMVKAINSATDETSLNRNLEVMRGRNPYYGKVVGAVTRKTWNRDYETMSPSAPSLEDMVQGTGQEVKAAIAGAPAAEGQGLAPVMGKAKDYVQSTFHEGANAAQAAVFPNYTLRTQDPSSGFISRGLGIAGDVFNLPTRVLTATSETLGGNGDMSFLQNLSRPDAYSNPGERLADFTLGTIVPGTITKSLGRKAVSLFANSNLGRRLGTALANGNALQRGIGRTTLPNETAHQAVFAENLLNPSTKTGLVENVAEGAARGLGEGLAYSAPPAAFLATSPEKSNPQAGTEAAAQMILGPVAGGTLGALGGAAKYGMGRYLDASPGALASIFGGERLNGIGSIDRLTKATAREPAHGSKGDVQLFQNVITPALEGGLRKVGARRDEVMSHFVTDFEGLPDPPFSYSSLSSKLGLKAQQDVNGDHLVTNDMPGFQSLATAQQDDVYRREVNGIMRKLHDAGVQKTRENARDANPALHNELQDQISNIGRLERKSTDPYRTQAYAALKDDLKATMQSEADNVAEMQNRLLRDKIAKKAVLDDSRLGSFVDLSLVAAKKEMESDIPAASQTIAALQSKLHDAGIEIFKPGAEGKATGWAKNHAGNPSIEGEVLQSLRDVNPFRPDREPKSLAEIRRMLEQAKELGDGSYLLDYIRDEAGRATSRLPREIETAKKNAGKLTDINKDFARIYGSKDVFDLKGAPGTPEESLFRKVARARLDPLTREHEFRTTVTEPMIALRDVLNNPNTGVNKKPFLQAILDQGGIDEGLASRLRESINGKAEAWTLKDLDYATPAVTRALRSMSKGEIPGGMTENDMRRAVRAAAIYGNRGVLVGLAPKLVHAVSSSLKEGLGSPLKGAPAPYVLPALRDSSMPNAREADFADTTGTIPLFPTKKGKK